MTNEEKKKYLEEALVEIRNRCTEAIANPYHNGTHVLEMMAMAFEILAMKELMASGIYKNEKQNNNVLAFPMAKKEPDHKDGA